jgi:hypothetical protein
MHCDKHSGNACYPSRKPLASRKMGPNPSNKIGFSEDGRGVLSQRKTKKIIVQAKSGHVNREHIRDLKAPVETERATIGAFLTLEPPTRPMILEALRTALHTKERREWLL